MSNTRWQLSGSIAENYEAFFVPVIFAPWARALLARADLPHGAEVLDLGCGTGIVARTAQAQGLHAAGVDINSAMLAVARSTSEGRAIDYREADATALPFDAGRFDAVICLQVLQFLPDRAAALAECFRVLRPGGQAIFCTARDISENPLIQTQAAGFDIYVGTAAAAAIRAVCGYTDAKATEALFRDAGFDPVTVEHVTIDLVAPDAQAFANGMMAATPAAAAIAALPAPVRDALKQALIEGFGACFDGTGLKFPHSGNVVRAIRPARHASSSASQ